MMNFDMKFSSAIVSQAILYFVSSGSGLAQDIASNRNLAKMIGNLGKNACSAEAKVNLASPASRDCRFA